MISIRLACVNGRLVGVTFSDRWNLAQLGLTEVPHDRNSTGLKRLRRAFRGEFSFTVVRNASFVGITDIEREAFRKPDGYATKVA